MRLVPYLLALAIIAIRYRPSATPRYLRALAIAGIAFFLVRTAGNTASFWVYDRTYDRELAALDHLPAGARLVSLVGEQCGRPWAMTRLQHLPGMAVVRRHAFSNDQWVMAGAQLLRVHYAEGWPYTQDPSQIVTVRRCPREFYRTVAQSLAAVPRDAFDYIWLIRPPLYDPRLTKGLLPVWRSGRSVLFRVKR
jgi:hypothetical protein